ncbi:MAG: CoA transferase [Hyphomicrobiaceae bacterium]|nr:CoA transferase [Hyphomicrobiaceae bacterium]
MANEAVTPLRGVRVLEIGSTVAGPFCGRMLADFGAEVIKVEMAEGDPVRAMGKHVDGKSLYAASIFRNKKNISVDMRKPEGQALIRRLALASDIVVENFRPGALERWGLGYEELSKENPRLIMVRVSGFGQTGPYSKRPGYGVIAEAVSGMRHLTGDPDRPPSRVAISLTDYITGLHAAYGAAMALIARNATGRGQVIDAALFECAFNFMETWIAAYEKTGHVANREGPRLPGTDPNNLYPTSDGGYIHITAMADAIFRRLAKTMGKPELGDDDRFATLLARTTNYAVLDEIISEWTRTKTGKEIEALMLEADVPVARIFTMADIFADPHYKARGAIISVPDPSFGTVTMAEVIPRLSATPGRVHHTGHETGADTRAVLGDILGLDDAELDRLERDGIVATKPIPRQKAKGAKS